MGKENKAILAFNRGMISPLALARIDIAKVALSAESQINWLPRLLGSMMLRPGLGYIGATQNNNQAIFLPFIFSKTQTALLEFTDSIIRFWVNDELLTRPEVTATITNGNFTTDLTGWTDNDQSGAASTWATGSFLQLVGDGVNQARRTQQVTVIQPGVEHAVRIVINRGPVKFRIGSTADNDDYVNEITLGTGTHSLAFTPSGNFYINFYSALERLTLVKSIAIESAGIVTLPSPYVEADLPLIRFDQSLDVIYLEGADKQQRELRRSGSGDSWSIILFQPEDGPVRVQNTTQISITPSALSGNITLTSNQSLFRLGHVGSVWKMVSVGQTVSQAISAADVFSDYIVVRGVGETRVFTVNISGTWVATITLERSFDEGVSWDEATTYTSNTTTTFNDGLDDQVVWYRIGIAAGDYTSGTANVSLSYSLGSITGYVRITAFSSTTSVSAEVLKDLGSTNPTTQWSEGEWSDFRGWPSAVALVEGRLGHAGNGKIIASISDAYKSYDDEIEGDSGLISRDLGAGAISDIYWLTSLYRLFAGCDTSVKAIKSTSFEEPITPTNFRVVEPSTQSCANVPPAKLDKKAIFVQGAGTRVYELTYDQTTIDYAAQELTTAVPEIGLPSIIRIAIQRQPDTIIHCVKSDGTVAVLLYDDLENLNAWFLFQTNGIVEDVVVLPGDIEDNVYYCVQREVDGNTVRYLEKFAMQNECQGGPLNKQADSFITYEGPLTTTITGLDHLEGEEVIVWADSTDLSPTINGVQTTYTVSGGSITLPQAVQNAVVGLPYSASYRSSKLAYAAGSPLGQRKKVNAIGVIIYNTHSQGLQYGRDFEHMDNLPLVNPVTGKRVNYNDIYSSLDTPQFSFNGEWNTDSRMCLAAQAPRPCTLLCAEIAITTNEKQ